MCVYWRYLIPLYIDWPSSIWVTLPPQRAFGGTSGKEPTANAVDTRDAGSISGSGRSPGGGNGNPLQHSCLESPWTEEPGGLQFVGLQRVRHDWGDLAQTQFDDRDWDAEVYKHLVLRGQGCWSTYYNTWDSCRHRTIQPKMSVLPRWDTWTETE